MNTLFAGLPLIALLAIIAAAGFFFILRLVRKHRAAYARFAARRGLRYDPVASSLPLSEFLGFSLFHTGWESGATHLVFGMYRGVEIYLFEFSYQSGPQMNDPETSQSMIALRAQDLPPFRLSPASGFTQSRQRTREMVLEAEAWSEPDRRRVFSESVLQQAGRTPGWHIECNGSWLILWKASTLFAPNEAEGFLNEAIDLAQTLMDR